MKPTIKVDERSLRALIENGMVDAVQQLLDTNSDLPYKIENGKLVDKLTGGALWLKKFITEDKDVLQMKSDAALLSRTDDEILITGETGVGKELIARAMIGDRVGNFVRINCAAMPEGLIEAELFGSESGAYTGSTGKKKGLILAAQLGVMFLDEVGDLPLPMQAKLLNVLQPVDGKRYIRPVGGTEEKEVLCRFVCATHRDLRGMVDKGTFRQDLYARISTFELHIKPLRERKGDIPAIVDELGLQFKVSPTLLKQFQTKYQEAYVNDKADLSLNVRSVEQSLKRFVVLGRV